MPSWKKIIVSGSNAELNQITATNYGGNVSGSSTSTGSFGKLLGDGSSLTGISSGVDIDSLDALGGTGVADSDKFIFSDAGTEKSITFSNLEGAIFSSVSGDATIASNGALTIAANSVEQSMISDFGIVSSSAQIKDDISGSFSKAHLTAKVPNVVSSSAQLASDISGSIVSVSSSLASRVTTNEGYLNQSVKTDASPVFAGLRVVGDISAERYIVSSSITKLTQSFSSGSTIFGDSIDDTHVFTGSLKITGSQTLVGRITPTEIGAFTAKGAIDFDNQNLTNIDIDSGDIASGVTINKSPVVNFNSGDVQGSITLSNLASGTGGLTIQANAVEQSMIADFGLLSGSAQIGTDISGSWQTHFSGSAVKLIGGGVSGSSVSTGSFGRVQATTIAGNSPITIDADVNFNVGTDISGSATSTGSFGRIESADNEATIGGHIVTIGGALTTGGTLTTAGNFTTQNNNVTINAAGAARTITLNESLTIGDGNDGTITFSGASKTLTVEDNSNINQDVTTDANVTFGSVTSTNNVTVGGNLIVNGTTSTLATTNLQIKDAFGFFATGSADTNVDAGIIVQSGSVKDSGSAIFHDISKQRWSVAKGVGSTDTNVPDSKWGGFVATVYTGSASPVNSSPKYGVGEIHIDENGEIYIYS